MTDRKFGSIAWAEANNNNLLWEPVGSFEGLCEKLAGCTVSLAEPIGPSTLDERGTGYAAGIVLYLQERDGGQSVLELQTAEWNDSLIATVASVDQ